MKYHVPRKFRLLAASIALLGLMPSGASAMHIAEGMLPKLGIRLDGGMPPICSFRFFLY